MVRLDDDVDAALDRLVAGGTLTPEQADAVRRAVAADRAVELDRAVEADRAVEPDRRPIGKVLAEIGGYVGAAFVVAGIAVFTGSHWTELPTWGQALVFGGPALLLVVAAGLVRRAGAGAPVTDRLAAALLLVAGGLAGGVTAVLLDPGGEGAGRWTFALVIGTVTVLWTAGYGWVRGGLLHVAALIGLAYTTRSVVETLADPDWQGPSSWTQLSGSFAVLGVAAAWGVLAWFGVLRERSLGLTGAAVTAFVGAQYLVTGGGENLAWPGYVATGLLALAGLAGYLRTKLVGLLVVGVVSLAVVVPEVVLDVTDGALSTAGALLVVGLSIVAASALGLRLRREVRV